jgi:Carboxypeptidase regulatory-like domain
MMFMHLKRLAAVLLFFLFAEGPLMCAYGQTATGQIAGKVTDESGAVIAGVSIKATNIDTQTSRSVTSNASGQYIFTLLPPGNYEVAMSKSGWENLTETAIKLDVSQNLTLNATLTVGKTSATVEVRGDTELLQLSGSQLGTVIGAQPVADLPLNGRNFTQLLTLTPGATPISTAQGAGIGVSDGSNIGIPGSSFSNPAINGQQNRGTLFLLDGVNNTDFRVTAYTILPIIDSISEFKVQSHDDDPAFGMVMGGVVNLVTKSGTNQVHGSAWEFVRNNIFDARNPFSDFNSDGQPNGPAPFRQNEFGGTFGGPVRIPKIYNGQNKTFFFFAYEGWRYTSPSGELYNVPTAAELNGDFTHSLGNTQIFDPSTTALNGDGTGYTRQPFAGSVVPPDRINPQMQTYLQTYLDKPNFTGNSGYNTILKTSQINNADTYQIRVDEKLTSRDDVFFRWSGQNAKANSPFTNTVQYLENFWGRNIGAGITHVFGPNLALNVNGGRADRPFTFVYDAAPGDGPLQSLGFINAYGPMAVSLSAPYGGTNLGGTLLRRDSSWSVASQLTWQLGKHTLSFGETFIDQYRSDSGPAQTLNFTTEQTADPANPSTTGNPVASALLALPAFGSFQLPTLEKFGIASWGVFAGDSWRVTPRLTLNSGIRLDHINLPNLISGMNNGFNFDTGNWEIGAKVLPPSCATSNAAPCIPGASTSAAANLAAIVGNDGSLAGSHIVVDAGNPTRGFAPYWGSYGPRIGFSYQAANTTVVRGGFGIVYDTLNGLSQTFENSFGSWPANNTSAPNYNSIGAPLTSVRDALDSISSPLPSATPFNNFGYYYSPKNKPFYSEQWNLELEQTIQQKILLSIAYVGSETHRLDYGGVANGAATPGPGTLEQVNARRPYPYMQSFVYDAYTASGSYHALQAKLQRRFSNGLQYLVSYTWSKSIDTGTSGRFGAEDGVGGGAAIQDYYDPKSNVGVSSYNLPHFASIAGSYELPFGKGKRFLNSGFKSIALGNWQINTVAQLSSGQPYQVNVQGDIANIGVQPTYVSGYGRPNLVGNPKLSHPTKQEWFNTAAFAVPSFSYGNAGRNTLSSSSVYSDDLSVFKTFPLAESISLEFRAEAFNVLNIMNYGVPDPDISDKTAGVVSGLAQINPRQLQLALKLSF